MKGINMNTKGYLESLINKTKNEQKKEIDKTHKKMNILMAATIFSIVFGIAGLTYTLPAGIAMLATSVATLSGYKKEKKRKKIIEDTYKKRLEHLDDIKKNGLKIDNTSKRERMTKYRQAQANISGKEEHIKNSNIRDNVTDVLAGGAGVVGFLLGGLTAITAPILAVYKLISNRVSNKDYEDYMNNKVEYDNVCDEFRIIKFANRNNNRNSNNNSNANSNSNTNSRNNVRRATSRLIPMHGNKSTYSREQLAAADKYVEALSKMNSTPEKPKTIVKK